MARTCPACGSETDAGAVQPCTECGFSPIDEPPQLGGAEVASEPVSDWDESSFGVGTNGDEGSPVVTEPRVSPRQHEAAERRARLPAVIVLALVMVGGAGALWGTGLIDTPPGPNPDDVEGQIALDAAAFGVKATIECPDSASETEVGETFECVATTNGGRSVTIRVINNEDTYEWNPQPLTRLRKSPS